MFWVLWIAISVITLILGWAVFAWFLEVLDKYA